MKGQGHITIDHLKGLVPKVIVFKYEENAFTNKEVMADVKISDKFDLHFQGH